MSLALRPQVVSRSSALRQIIRDASHSFPFSPACPGQCTPQELAKVDVEHKLQALVYDILPSTTAVFSYAIGSRKLLANEQFFLLVLSQK